MPLDPDLAAWLKLSLTPGLTGAHLRRLLAAFGDPERVLAAGRRALAKQVTDAIAVAVQQGAAPDALAAAAVEAGAAIVAVGVAIVGVRASIAAVLGPAPRPTPQTIPRTWPACACGP